MRRRTWEITWPVRMRSSLCVKRKIARQKKKKEEKGKKRKERKGKERKRKEMEKRGISSLLTPTGEARLANFSKREGDLFLKNKKKKKSHPPVLLIAIPIERVMWVDRWLSLEGILRVFLHAKRARYLTIHICNPFFFLQISSWRQRPPTQKKNHHPNLPHKLLLPSGVTQDELKWGHVFFLWSLFWICAFLPLLGSCEGKTQKKASGWGK